MKNKLINLVTVHIHLQKHNGRFNDKRKFLKYVNRAIGEQ